MDPIWAAAALILGAILPGLIAIGLDLMWPAALTLRVIVPGLIAIGLVRLRWPKSVLLRLPFAILAGWVIGVLLVIFVYNPLGIAHGHALGEDFPEGRYDNNIVSIQLMLGWIVPLACGLLAALIRGLSALREARRQSRPPA